VISALSLALACGVPASLALAAQPNAPAAARAAEAPRAAQTPLIPRATLFGNPSRAMGRISPDGSMLAFLAPHNGVLNVHVAPVDDLSKARAVTTDAKRGIMSYFWTYSGRIVYTQDTGGDENWRLYAIDPKADGAAPVDLTPIQGVQARIEAVSRKFPDVIVVGINDRDPSLHDLYRINVSTGERTLLFKNPRFAGAMVDDDYNLRLVVEQTPEGGAAYWKVTGPGKAPGEFELAEAFTIGTADEATTRPVDFSADGQTLYMLDSRGRNTAALFSVDLASGKSTLVFEDEKTDVSDVLINPITKEIEAVQTDYDKATWTLTEKGFAIEPELRAFRKAAGMGDMNITSRSLTDRYWTMTLVRDNGPAETWLIDRGEPAPGKRTPKATRLFVNKPELAQAPLVPMHPREIPARDGLTLMSYLSLPLEADSDKDGTPERPVPLVLLVHGGPWARDSWGLDPEAQWLANRGYAVLQVNFRGSTGFGKEFLNAGNREWAGKMHDDLIDAVNWAVENKVAVRDRVAIMGASYGGYAALAGLTFTPEVFACGVSVVGPSNLNTLIGSIPDYWKPLLESFYVRVGDPRTPEGRQFLEERSPLTRADKIVRPLLIGQGANDPRVKQAESDQIVKAMQGHNIPATYALYPDEGHGFARPANRISFYAVAEAFLAAHLGGRAEPFGDDLKGSTLQIPAGVEHIPGLKEAVGK
jgi:dipeptidyl aminopeptidase/acylaminoacyl peptidase